MKKTLLLALAVIAVGCAEEESDDARYGRGWSDGYAFGYNGACEITGILIEGDYDDNNYFGGYMDGYAEGVSDCENADTYDPRPPDLEGGMQIKHIRLRASGN